MIDRRLLLTGLFAVSLSPPLRASSFPDPMLEAVADAAKKEGVPFRAAHAALCRSAGELTPPPAAATCCQPPAVVALARSGSAQTSPSNAEPLRPINT